MIELLLQGRRAMALGMVEQAERLYWQAVEADPHNAMAVVGLAEVAMERGDEATAHLWARKALGLDPENLAAQRLAARTAEIMRERGVRPPDAGAPLPGRPAEVRESTPAAEPSPSSAPPRRPGLIRRILGGR